MNNCCGFCYHIAH